MEDVVFKFEELRNFVHQVWIKSGFSEDDAALATSNLLEADLRGIDSHGVARLQGYLNLIQVGRINPTPNITIEAEALATATLDADAAVGLVSGSIATDMAIEKAKKCGIGMVVVNHSNHFGIAYSHLKKALSQGFIGISFTNASAFVAPAGGIERMLGTNPMCYAFPSPDGRHVVVDLATSAAANGKLEIAERKGKPIPKGWVMDAEGNSSTDPSILKKGGMMLPLGSFEELGVHKGFGLSAVVDLFSGVLSGANFGPWVPPFPAFAPLPEETVGKGIGHCFWIINPEAFRTRSSYDQAILTWIHRFKSSIPAVENIPVIIPGEPEMAYFSERMEKGIPLNPIVADQLKKISEKMEIPL
jgi:LDH2 family malate/lactate/ureidoglycolate dehydrogenase